MASMTENAACRRLPGDLTKKQLVEQIVRVNQAGEYGAKRIYAGQMEILKDDECFAEIKHMAEQEEEHLAYFNEQIASRRVRPTLMAPVWHVAGYVLGAATAMMGKKAAMACTVAVEEVIDEHYREQLAQLGDDEKELKDKIAKFREDELEHRATGLRHDAEQAAGYPLLAGGVKAASRLAIWLSKKV